MKVVNNIHVISKGTLLSLAFHMFILAFIVITGFNTSLPTLTGVLIISTAVASFYVGIISDRYAEINGIIVALLVSLIFLLFLNFYTPMNLKANEVIVASYIVIGFLFSLASRLTNKKLRTENKVNKPKPLKKAKDNVKPSNEQLLNKSVASKPLKHSVKKKVDSYTNALNAKEASEASTESKIDVSKPTVKKEKNYRYEKTSDQANIRQELLKEIEREKAQRKNKK